MNTNWQHWFPRETLRRGEAYYRSDCVYDFEFKGNRCTADVFGSYIYKVKISNPGKNNMTMRCTCPHARDGFNCKHMATVLYQWQELADAVLTGENRSIGSMTKEKLLELLYK